MTSAATNVHATYRKIDHLASFGMLTTADIAERVGVSEAQVSNYLAQKGGAELIKSHKLRLVKNKGTANEVERLAAEREAILKERHQRLRRIERLLFESVDHPLKFVDPWGTLIRFDRSTPQGNEILELGNLLLDQVEHVPRAAQAKWSQKAWASKMIDWSVDTPDWAVAAVAKYCYSLRIPYQSKARDKKVTA